MDPQIEHAGLDELVEEFNEAKRAGYRARMQRADQRIREALEPELQHRFDVAARSYSLLFGDGRQANPGLGELEKPVSERHTEYIEMESELLQGGQAWVTSPETDGHSLIAASQYVMLEADRDRTINALVHYDADLQDDLLATGDGVRGRIVRIEDESEGRRTRAVWVVESDATFPLRVRPGDILAQAGYPKRKVEVREIVEGSQSSRRFELAVISGIREGQGLLGRIPLDQRWNGKIVTFLALGEPGFAYMKRKMLWDRDGPGTWLTASAAVGRLDRSR